MDERYLVAMRRGHPAVAKGAALDLDRWLAHPHVVVSGRGSAATPLDAALAARGLSRRVAVVVPSFLMVPPLLRGSDLIALLPSRCVPPASSGWLVTRPPPVEVEGFRLCLAWHGRADGDAVVQHVAREIAAALRGAPSAVGAGRPAPRSPAAPPAARRRRSRPP